MRRNRVLLLVATSLVGLLLSVDELPAQETCNNRTLKGTYEYAPVNNVGANAPRVSGTLTFEEHGLVVGLFGGDQDGSRVHGAFTGKYFLYANCTGRMLLTTDQGESRQAEFTMEPRSSRLEFLNSEPLVAGVAVPAAGTPIEFSGECNAKEKVFTIDAEAVSRTFTISNTCKDCAMGVTFTGLARNAEVINQGNSKIISLKANQGLEIVCKKEEKRHCSGTATKN